MAAIVPSRITTGTSVPVKRITPVNQTSVSDADTITFSEFTTLTGAAFMKVSDGTLITTSIATNVVTIGVHVPPLASVPVVGLVFGS